MCKFNLKNEGRRLDPCMKPLIKWLKESDYWTVGCCCGHGRYPMTIIVKGMRNGVPNYGELLSGVEIPRKKRFYKRDKDGYYYIPEISKPKK